MTTSGLFYVYEHWRLDRDECFYVGKGRGGRAYSMKNRNRHHQAIVAKLGRIGSAFEVRMVSTGFSEHDAFELEKERIAFWRSAGSDLTNLTIGGEGVSGLKHTDESKAKMGLTHLGNKYNLGRVWTDEQRKSMSEKKRGCKAPVETKKMKKNRLANIQKSAVTRRKKVICINDGVTFDSVVEAASRYNVCKTTISAICHGKRNAAYGLKFKFVEAV
jgi:group I intron endonuclease